MNTEFAHVYFSYTIYPNPKEGKKARLLYHDINKEQNNYLFNTGSMKYPYSELNILLFRQDVQ